MVSKGVGMFEYWLLNLMAISGIVNKETAKLFLLCKGVLPVEYYYDKWLGYERKKVLSGIKRNHGK